MLYRSTHSNAVFGSNAAWAASNHVYLKTHPDAVFGSNAAWATSNQVNLKTHPDAVFGSNTACGTSNHVYLKTHPDAVFGSNAGGSAYNIAINCSNLLFPVIAPTALLASNVSFTCSNTLFGVTVPQAFFASNHSHWASNTSLASSNFLFANLTPSCFFPSNLAHKTSVVAAYTSNVVNETLYPMASFASNNSIGLTYLTNPTIRAYEVACVLFATPSECSVTLSNLMDGGNLSLRVSDVKGASLYSSSPKGLMSVLSEHGGVIGVAASSVTTRLGIDIEQSCAVNGLSSFDVGFVTTTGALAFTGEWVDMVLPDPITLGAYSISPIISTHTGQPRCFVVLGRSSDGESWQVVDTTYATTPYPVTGAVIIVTSVPPSLPSSRFRIVLTRVRVSTSETETRVSARVGQVRLFGEPSSHSFLSLRHDTCLLSTHLGVGVSTPGTSAVAVSGSMSLSGQLGVGETLLGTEPAFSLQLVRDSAAKPSSSTWTVTSDRRIKENICNADLERCYEIVREVPLRRFSWRKDVYTPDQCSAHDILRKQRPFRFDFFGISADFCELLRSDAARNTGLILPKYYGLERFGTPSNSDDYFYCDDAGGGGRVAFIGQLRPVQESVVSSFLERARDPKVAGGIITLPCGGGKTVVALKIASDLACKTLIVVHKEFLLSQWRERIEQFMPYASVGLVKAGVTDTHGRDVVLASLQSLSMKSYAADTFSEFGLLIVDECHRVGTEVFSRALFKTTFRYSLGLSATPDRKDGMTRAIVYHLGPHVPLLQFDDSVSSSTGNDRVVRVRVVRFSSDAREYAREEVIHRRIADGRMKAAPCISRMITNVCDFEPRTAFVVELISDVLASAPDRRVLVLSDRKSQLQHVHDLLVAKGIAVGFYWGGMKNSELKASASRRVICATFPYAAEGMDIPELDTLVLASPKTDVV
eukprot:gene8442-biopygen3785